MYGIKWEDRISDLEILESSRCESIEALVLKQRLRWSGHLVRMKDSRKPKQLF
uniref:Uncharacterized protein n=1 Tax=Octopus bimaculoides TaxID=37653 RepID=A0A0L8HI40_OCTBM